MIGLRIADGTYKPGAEIPALEGLAEEQEVDIKTVKMAVQHLKEEGILVGDGGPQGIYVADPLPATFSADTTPG